MLKFNKGADKPKITKKHTKKSRKVSMRAWIFIAFIIFSAVVLAALWLTQTVFMDDLYKRVRLSELDKCADVLVSADVEDYEDSALELSEEYNICITVYEIRNGRGVAVVTSHVDSGCFIHNLNLESTHNDSLLTRLYKEAKNSGSDGYMENVSLPEDDDSDYFIGDILYSRVVTKGNTEYMLLFNTEIYPLDSTVSSMRMMLFYISILLIAVAAVMSAVIASMMSSAVTKMSKEAGRLALGDYDVRFEGGPVREHCELADALNHAAGELSSLDRMQKDLIANVSHDLRTPLTLISGYSEVMRDIPGEMTADNMQVIIDESARLSSLVNDMLDMSRFISGKQVLNPERFSITEAVRETVERYTKMCEKDGYTVEFEYDGEVFVKADSSAIVRVIFNLLNNAVNYTGDDRRVVVKQLCRDNVCRIEFTDSGCGIAEEDLPLIWERYYRANEFHKRSVVGTGLGLSIVKNILALHKARFGVRSRVGHGSTFWFELPVNFEEING